MQPRMGRPVYRQLAATRDIRLLTIHPGRWNEEVCCNLTHHSLPVAREARPAYSALSYVWGSPKVTDKILLDGEPWHVTVNLSHALHFLRETEEPVRVWVDALVSEHAGTPAKDVPKLTRDSASTRATSSSAATKSA